jgi:hypothetical protein
VRGVGRGHISERERRHHRGVPDGLEVHVAAIVGALQLDDDELDPGA